MEDKNVRFIRTQVSRSGEVAGHATPRSLAASPKPSKGAPGCAVCGDTGWKTLMLDPDKRVIRCDCTARSRSAHLLAQARIPPRYENCDLASYQTEGSQRGVASAKLAAEKFVEQY